MARGGTVLTLVRPEDFDAQLREILLRAGEVGRTAEAASLKAGHEVRRLPAKPPTDPERALEQLKEALEDEVVLARTAQGAAVIEEREEHREIAKRALVHIKLPVLRQIAENMGLPASGTLDEVADRIVRAYKMDERAIAELVVTYEAEPPPERRFTTRIFHLSDEPPDVGALAARIELFTNRYIRTGIARWFVIEKVALDPLLTMRGTFRFYRADAEEEEEQYRLRADRDSATASLTLQPTRKMTEVEAKAEGESRAIMAAFERASNLRWRDSLPLAATLPEGPLFAWDPRSAFLVDLLNTRFGRNDVEIFNLNVAGFQTRRERASADTESTRPAVRAVRFQGQHLLDSRTACELIIGGQGLVELGMLVRFRPSADENHLLPLTLRLERDHALVATGFGANPPQAARMLHRVVLGGVERAFGAGFLDESRLRLVASQIAQRAATDEPVTRATMFGPPTGKSADGR